MGILYQKLKRIKEKIQSEGGHSYEPYTAVLEKFITLLTYEDTYLMKKLSDRIIITDNGKTDILLLCGEFGVIIDKDDRISIHT